MNKVLLMFLLIILLIPNTFSQSRPRVFFVYTGNISNGRVRESDLRRRIELQDSEDVINWLWNSSYNRFNSEAVPSGRLINVLVTDFNLNRSTAERDVNNAELFSTNFRWVTSSGGFVILWIAYERGIDWSGIYD